MAVNNADVFKKKELANKIQGGVLGCESVWRGKRV